MTDQEVGNRLNSEALQNVIRECAQEMADIKKQRQGLNEQAGELRERLRDAGVHVKAFNFAMQLMEMEGVARDGYMVSLTDAHKALDIGGQLDWVSAAHTYDLVKEA